MTSKSSLKLVLEIIADTGKITPELLSHLTNDERQLIETIILQGSVNESLNFLKNIDSEVEWKLVENRLIKPKALVTPLWKSIIRYAAIFVTLFALVYAIQNKNNVEVPHQVSEKDNIRLMLGNDQVKVLAQGGTEDIVVSGEIVANYVGSSIIYNSHTGINQLIFHQVVVPYGKVLDIELSDGTVVHLNSGSKMRYPVQFLEGKSREVFVEGEAYFDVSKDKKHPFIVNADAVSIEVLGTKFAVSTYTEDLEINAVLVEGSISMSNSYIPEDVITLTPGTKGSWDKTGHQTKMEDVDVENYISWMKGELVFRNTPFEIMEKKLERKYNVEIKNNNSLLSKKVFNASFSENIESIEDVLKYISELYPFNYKISNNHILIY
ncbi:FecR family protein [Gelidibacter gilvus]|uniref:FecR family protein n=1 Tax=Gelidibacter gilvus TaxID=59602 RepID=A0A4Q0XJI2_9FLAO|nr:FecR family protein [Gelidibacter gilvus]RXJ50442.1 FecR family protein [Gelidibacter gilvus]